MDAALSLLMLASVGGLALCAWACKRDRWYDP